MVRTFLVRGMLVGIVAGLLSFAFLKIYGEPQVDRAVAFETQQDEAKAAAQKAESHNHASAPTITLPRPTRTFGAVDLLEHIRRQPADAIELSHGCAYRNVEG